MASGFPTSAHPKMAGISDTPGVLSHLGTPKLAGVSDCFLQGNVGQFAIPLVASVGLHVWLDSRWAFPRPTAYSWFAYVRFTAWRDARGQHDWQVPGRGEPNCDRVLGQEQRTQEDWILGNRRWKEPHDSGTVKGKAGAVFDWQCGVPAWCTTLASLHRHVARTGSCCGGRQVPANLPASSGNQQSSSRSRECGHSTFAAILYRSLFCFNTCFNTTSWALSHHIHQMFWDAIELPVQWTMKAFIEL